jgi:hypothetical protein
VTVVASGYDRVENDLYQTPEWATEALLRHLPIAGLRVWEPAAGNHKMVDVLAKAGASVFTSDIKTYNRQHDQIFDFLVDFEGIDNTLFDAIITNPPFGHGNRDAAKFARHALRRCRGFVALLMTAKFDFGKTRVDLFRDSSRFLGKISLLDRLQFFPGMDGTEDHAWYIWGAGPRDGYATILYEGKQP